ncbi:hypothetical protein KIPB_001108 [Kipferlia bialata]|uniref:Uncharacterized protein n=1 Tax=Kipferlia bialata TaxID=797122 RepID=A0A9K3CNB1_9EUKA|nr:hypothetical protein KIPB_001108 [Kipferlia bialata]|eukprot:g1108.t1
MDFKRVTIDHDPREFCAMVDVSVPSYTGPAGATYRVMIVGDGAKRDKGRCVIASIGPNATVTEVQSGCPSTPSTPDSLSLSRIGDKVYMVIGCADEDGDRLQDDLHIYDIGSKKWSKSSSPCPVRDGHAAVVSDGLLICAGGGYGAETRRTWQYDPDEDDWTRLADSPINLSYAAGTAVDEMCHFVGNLAYSHRTHAVYDTITDRWEKRGVTPCQVYNAAAVTIEAGGESGTGGQEIWLIGGFREVGGIRVTGRVHRLSLSTCEWEEVGAGIPISNVGGNSACRVGDDHTVPTLLVHGPDGSVLVECHGRTDTTTADTERERRRERVPPRGEGTHPAVYEEPDNQWVSDIAKSSFNC